MSLPGFQTVRRIMNTSPQRPIRSHWHRRSNSRRRSKAAWRSTLFSWRSSSSTGVGTFAGALAMHCPCCPHSQRRMASLRRRHLGFRRGEAILGVGHGRCDFVHSHCLGPLVARVTSTLQSEPFPKKKSQPPFNWRRRIFPEGPRGRASTMVIPVGRKTGGKHTFRSSAIEASETSPKPVRSSRNRWTD